MAQRKQTGRARTARPAERSRDIAQQLSELEGLLNSTLDAILVIDEDQKLIRFNHAAEVLYRCPAAEALGQPLDRFMPMESRDKHHELVRRFGRSGESSRSMHSPSLNLRCLRADGTDFLGDISISKHQHNGRPAYVAIVRDVTERMEAQQAREASEQRWRSLYENMLDGLAHGRVLYEAGVPRDFIYLGVNPAFEELTGLTDVVGRKVSEVIPGVHEANPELLATYAQVAATGVPQRFETYVQGLKRWFMVAVYRPIEGEFIVEFDNITERRESEKRIRQQVERLSALREIDRSVLSTLDMQVSLNTVIAHTIRVLDMDAACILLLDPALQTLRYAAGAGFRTQAVKDSVVRLGADYAGKAAAERRIVQMSEPHALESVFASWPGFAEEGFAAYFGVPLIAKGELQGVMEVFARRPFDPDKDWLEFMGSLAGQAAIAIDNATLFSELQRSNAGLISAYDATIEGWARALDLRDRETEGHSRRVTEMCIRLARMLGLAEEDLVHIRRGALLHDIGKLGVPDAILAKAGPLTDDEWRVMRAHPSLAHDMLAPIAYLRPALDIPWNHHEKWDGSGYPRGLKGDDIPLAARIFAVVDVWDALTSERPYRPAWTEAQALEYMLLQSGKHFDPRIADAFIAHQVWKSVS